MNTAAIDCGTNSVRLLVTDSSGVELERLMRITRLGQGVDASGRLAPAAIERTLQVLAEYAEVCRDREVAALRVAATSAARDAENADEFFGPATTTLGVRPELLSGGEEAELSFAGAIEDRDPKNGPFLVCDIGGGSTELIFGTAEPEALVSVDIGCVRLTERCLHSDPPSAAEIAAASAEVDRLVGGVAGTVPVEHASELVGLAGTVTSLAALVAGLDRHDASVTHGMRMSRVQVGRCLEELAAVPVRDRRARLIDADRADVIVGGAIVLSRIMEQFGFDEVVVSEHDILDGLAATVRTAAPRGTA